MAQAINQVSSWQPAVKAGVFAPARAVRRGAWLIGGVSLLAALAGCADDKAAKPAHPVPTLVEQRLADSSERIASALEQLSRVEQAAEPAQIAAPVDPKDAPVDLRMLVTWEDYQGPLLTAVKGIADRIGYKVTVHGVEPPAPVIVKVDAVNVPVIQVLENLGLQAGNRATVHLEADSTMIHLYFAPPKSSAW